MYQEIHYYRAMSVVSVEINISLLIMRKLQISILFHLKVDPFPVLAKEQGVANLLRPVLGRLLLVHLHAVAEHHNRLRVLLLDHQPEVVHCTVKWSWQEAEYCQNMSGFPLLHRLIPLTLCQNVFSVGSSDLHPVGVDIHLLVLVGQQHPALVIRQHIVIPAQTNR